LIGLLAGVGLEAQGAEGWKASAIYTVMDYRAQVLADTTAKFDRCSIDRQLGGADAAPVPSQIADQVQRMIAPCDRGDGPPYRAVVSVDSLTRSGTDVTVYIAVVHGEWVHREAYALYPLDAATAYMGVREVRLTPGVQFYRGRRPRRDLRSPD
jgi:hypothetical protein